MKGKKYLSVVMIISIPKEDHFVAMKIDFKKKDVESKVVIYDSLSDKSKPELMGRFTLSNEQICDIVTQSLKKFKSSNLEVRLVSSAQNVAGDANIYTVKVHDGTNHRMSEVHPAKACGEFCCMEIIGATNPSFFKSAIWGDKWEHRAFILSRIIQLLAKDEFLYLLTLTKLQRKPESFNLELETDPLCFRVKSAVQEVIRIDFGTNFVEIFQNVVKCYGCWPIDSCQICESPLYTVDGQELIIRLCCGGRFHAECFVKNRGSRHRLVFCIA